MNTNQRGPDVPATYEDRLEAAVRAAKAVDEADAEAKVHEDLAEAARRQASERRWEFARLTFESTAGQGYKAHQGTLAGTDIVSLDEWRVMLAERGVDLSHVYLKRMRQVWEQFGTERLPNRPDGSERSFGEHLDALNFAKADRPEAIIRADEAGIGLRQYRALLLRERRTGTTVPSSGTDSLALTPESLTQAAAADPEVAKAVKQVAAGLRAERQPEVDAWVAEHPRIVPPSSETFWPQDSINAISGTIHGIVVTAHHHPDSRRERAARMLEEQAQHCLEAAAEIRATETGVPNLNPPALRVVKGGA